MSPLSFTASFPDQVAVGGQIPERKSLIPDSNSVAKYKDLRKHGEGLLKNYKMSEFLSEINFILNPNLANKNACTRVTISSICRPYVDTGNILCQIQVDNPFTNLKLFLYIEIEA